MIITAKDTTLKLTTYDEKVIYALLVKQEGLSPSELNDIFYPDHEDKRSTEMGFRRSCEKLNKLRHFFPESEKSLTLLSKKKYRGIQARGYKYSVNMTCFLYFYNEYYQIYDFFHPSYLPDIRNRIITFLSSKKDHLERQYLPRCIGDTEKWGLKSMFIMLYDEVFELTLKKKQPKISKKELEDLTA